MPAPIYKGVTGGAVALSAATAKSVLGARAHANSGLLLSKFSVGFDGVTASAVPVLVELCYATFATNGTAGTNNTTVTAAQQTGRVLTAGFTMMKNWTSEPTVLTVQEEFLLTPNGGLVVYDVPLGKEPDTALNEGFVIRCTAPATVNVRASIEVSRI
jgi:hypothetical protein